ncbi:MAG: hypothetical protein F8N36_13710 [Desulfovibrio sp.]|uniref:hypothetical protein n=1 Tax=Desulfovibrio sp. TaxID=885 RepID=UPI00135EA617|nr:hypothetical protein [Desulfovibrio sp.]MTJ93895.1 hypothetical protein [Desulfovibrio sp.]
MSTTCNKPVADPARTLASYLADALFHLAHPDMADHWHSEGFDITDSLGDIRDLLGNVAPDLLRDVDIRLNEVCAVRTQTEQAAPSPKVLDMTRKGQYADGSPIYGFSTGFPSRGVRQVGEVHTTTLEAYQEGVKAVEQYQAADSYGNMGEVCGVTAVEGGYRAVINTYHSNT